MQKLLTLFSESNVAKFSLIDLVIKFTALLFIPVFAFLLPPSELGRYGEWYSFYLLFFGTSSLALPTLLVIRFTKNNDVSILNLFTNHFFKWNIIFSPLILLICLTTKNFFLIGTSYICALGYFYIDLYSSYFRVKRNINSYTWLQTINLISLSIVPAIFSFGFIEYEFRVLSIIFPMFILIIVFNKIKAPKQKKIKAKDTFLSSFKFGFPIALLSALGFLKFGFDIQSIKNIDDFNLAGTLTLSFQIMSVITIAGAVITRNASPELYKLYSSSKRKEVLIAIFKYSLPILIISFIAVAFFSLAKGSFIKFQHLEIFVIPMIISAVIYVISQLLMTLFFFQEKSYIVSLLNATGAIIHPFITTYFVSNQEYIYIGFSYLFSSIFQALFVAMIFILNFKKITYE